MRTSFSSINQNSIQYDVTLEEIRRKESAIDKYIFYAVFFPVTLAGYGLILYFLVGKLDKMSQFRGVLIVACFLMAVVSGGIFMMRKRKMDREISDLKNAIKENHEEEKHEEDYFNTLVSVNIKNLGDYYELVKDSNAKSFWTSLSIASVGIVFIFIGIFTGISNNYEYQTITYISSISGIFIELITGVLFYLYNKTIIQLKEYHSSLLDVQNVLLSFKLIGDIKDDNTKIDLIKEMISSLNKHI